MLNIKTNVREVDAYIRAVIDACDDPLDFLLPWGQTVARAARDSARAKGGRRFWREIAKATRVRTVSRHAVQVANWHVAGAQKQFGGDIVPRAAKALTIPISAEAEGKRASEFEAGGRQLFVIKSKSGDPATKGILGYSEGDQFHALFVLRTRVRQQPEPWFPDAHRIEQLGMIEAAHFVQRGIQP